MGSERDTLQSRLANLPVGYWKWQERAACANKGVEHFYHPEIDKETLRKLSKADKQRVAEDRKRREATAKAICAKCPVLVDCRDHALNIVKERFGIWGGTTEEGREDIFTAQRQERRAAQSPSPVPVLPRTRQAPVQAVI